MSLSIISADCAVISAEDSEQTSAPMKPKNSQDRSVFPSSTPKLPSVLDFRANAESKTVADSHAKEACVHHTRVLKARGLTALEVSNMHTNEACLSYQNPFIHCTAHPGGADAIYHMRPQIGPRARTGGQLRLIKSRQL